MANPAGMKMGKVEINSSAPPILPDVKVSVAIPKPKGDEDPTTDLAVGEDVVARYCKAQRRRHGSLNQLLDEAAFLLNSTKVT